MMKKAPRNPSIDEYIQSNCQWSEALSLLREILLSCGLAESIKWRQPCYTYHGVNIAILGSQRAHCILSFFNGSQLDDPEKMLELPGPNTQSGRVIRFTSAAQVHTRSSTLTSYVQEAIQKHLSGKQKNAQPPQHTLVFPPELVLQFEADPLLHAAFTSLTPGRQRGYLLFFMATSKPETRRARIEKQKPRILQGIGIHECHCGLSQKMPRCDGSHQKKESGYPDVLSGETNL